VVHLARGGGTVALPLLSHVLGGGAFLLELLSRAWKIQLSARALRVPLGFGAALRTCLGGDFGAAVTPARSGAEPARYLVLTEARVPAAGRLLILFAELVLEMFSLAAVVLVLAVAFRGAGGALLGSRGSSAGTPRSCSAWARRGWRSPAGTRTARRPRGRGGWARAAGAPCSGRCASSARASTRCATRAAG
jgi:hypothetical protein